MSLRSSARVDLDEAVASALDAVTTFEEEVTSRGEPTDTGSARVVLESLLGLPARVETVLDLASWNEVRPLLVGFKEPLHQLNVRAGSASPPLAAAPVLADALSLVTSRFEPARRSVLGRDALPALLLQDLWKKNASRPGHEIGTLAAQSPLLASAASWAQALVRGDHALVRKAPGASACNLARACEVRPFSSMLLVPLGAVGALDVAVQEVLVVGPLTPELQDRAAVVDVLFQDNSEASLADLFEASSDL